MKNKKMYVGAGPVSTHTSKARQNKGITLIALIITIIIMLILVAVTITTAINGGLFEKAGKAVGDNKNSINAEQGLASGRIQIDGVWYDSMDDYLEYTKKDKNPGVLESIGTDTYEINSIEDLVALAYSVNKGESIYLGKTIEVGKNLDFKNDLSYADPQAKYVLEAEGTTETGYKPDETGTSIKELLLGNNGFIPIGTNESSGFYGTIKGNNRVIKNMKITSITTYGGLIGKTPGNTETTISDLGMEDSDINVNSYAAGGILGYGDGTVVITNCYNTGNVTTGYGSGGIIGVSGAGNTTIDRCYNEGKIVSTVNTGGIVGTGGFTITITNCYNIGEVSSQNWAGGIAGYPSNTSIKNCYNVGTVSSNNTTYIGAITGAQYNSSIINCYFKKGSAAVGIGNSGTGEATEKEEAYMKTDAFLNELRVSIHNTIWTRKDGINNGMPIFGTGEIITYAYDEATKDEKGFLTENATYTSGEYTAVVPKGFKVIPGLKGSTSIADGLVIQDKDGNEFVWIPVTYTKTNTDTNGNGYDDGFDAVFYRSNWSNNARGTTKYTDTSGSSFNEPYASGYSGEGTEYNQMVKSVYDNGGFYIGRYEAGIKTTESPRTKSTTGSSNMVVQRDCYPYNYVGWGNSMNDYISDVRYNTSSNNQTNGSNFGKGALYLSKHMYDGKDIGAISTLCYGIQWDAMLDFIKDSTHNVTSDISWGNYYDNTYTITRETAKYATINTSTSLLEDWIQIPEAGKSKTSSESILLTTGADDRFAAKNIYDVAGNVFEWTNEVYSSGYRVVRGGSTIYGVSGLNIPASARGTTKHPACELNKGFRPVLYIK